MFTCKIQQKHNQNCIKSDKIYTLKQQQGHFKQHIGPLWKELRNQSVGKAPPDVAATPFKIIIVCTHSLSLLPARPFR